MIVLMLAVLPLAAHGSEELSNDTRREVLASDVSARIEAGEKADFDNCIIIGDLTLTGLNIEAPVHFNHTIFQKSVEFRSTSFNGPVYFEESTFNGDADFRDAAFNGDASFENSAFNSNADFWRSAFNDTANFWGSVFNRNADFMNSTFNGDAKFMGSIFNGNAYFDHSIFNGTASFWGSAFKVYAYFKDSDFNGLAYFKDTAFNGSVAFEKCRFNTTDFTLAQFDREASFDDSQFNGTTSFNSSRFKEDALFEGTYYNCTLYLMRTKYDKLFIRWGCIKDLAYDDAAYLSLMENFKKLGYLEDYDNCYYEYRREHRDRTWGGRFHGMAPVEEWIRKRVDFGLEIFYGYGKKPLYPLGWSIGTVLLFGIIWMIGGLRSNAYKSKTKISMENDSDEVSAPEGQSPVNDSWRVLQTLADAMIFSITVFLSGTRLFIDPPELPETPRWSRSRTKILFTAERVLGGFFSILFFLAIGATVVR